MGKNRPDASVALCTYKRPNLLKKCLESLLRQNTNRSFEIIAVDNDMERSAEAIVEAYRQQAAELGIPLLYAVEPEQNIALARNRSIALCSGSFVAFIDDDEVAAPDWLENLFLGMEKYKADAVLGPALPIFPEGFPKWLQESRIYSRSKCPSSGTRITKGGGSGNALLRKELLEARPSPFAKPFGKTGGSDSELFDWLTQRGYVFRRCNEARVYEVQELYRAKLWWNLRRGYRLGWGWSSALHKEKGFRRGVTKCLLREVSEPWNILRYIFKDIANPRGAFFHAARKIATDLGQLGYWLGLRIEEYKARGQSDADIQLPVPTELQPVSSSGAADRCETARCARENASPRQDGT